MPIDLQFQLIVLYLIQDQEVLREVGELFVLCFGDEAVNFV